MYPSALEKILKKKGISIGDRVRIVSAGQTGQVQEGILLPRAYEKAIWVLKLGNGYNIGIAAEGATIERLEKSIPPPAAMPTERQRGEIAVLGCGGTIASKVEYKTGAVYPAISPEELRASFPQLERIATIHTRQLFSIFSEDMNATHWQRIAEACAREIKEGVQGIVLMHGTDTLGYTSAALSFMLQSLPVPIVVVGAQRSSDRPSSDNEMNLLNAVFASTQDFAGVAVCMHASTNDTFAHLHRGTRVRKMHSSRRDAFQSINAPPLARVDYQTRKFETLDPCLRRDRNRKLQLHTKMNDNVAMVYSHPGIRPEFLEGLDDYDGIVLVATGMGHVPTNPFGDTSARSLLPAIKELIASDVPVVVAPQTLYGRIDLDVYTAGRLLLEAGVIGNGCDWLPETAFVKLCWALGQTKAMKKIKELMETNIAGEINTRSPLDFRTGSP